MKTFWRWKNLANLRSRVASVDFSPLRIEQAPTLVILKRILTARCRSPNSNAQYLARSSERLSRPAEAERRRAGVRGAGRRGGGMPVRGSTGALRGTRPTESAW